MSSILRGLNENNELLSEDKVALAELDKAAFEAEQALKSVDQVTKNIKYGTDTTEIIVGVQSIADTLKGFDHKELNYYEDKVREANNNLESAVYGLREPFNDLARDLRLKHDELEMDLEDIDEGQRCWKGYKKQGTKKMFGKTVNNCVKADESTDKDLADRIRDRQQQFKNNSSGDFWDHGDRRRGFKPFRDPDDPFWKKRIGKELPLTWRQKELQKQLFPTESEEVDEGMYDQDAFDAIFKDKKDRGSMEKPKSTPQDTGMYNPPNSKSNKDKKLDEFQRGSFDDDKPKRPSKGKLVTKDGMPVTLPLRTQDFRGDPIVIVDYIPPHKPSSTGRIVTDDGMTYFPGVADLKIIGHQFDVDEGLAGAASGAYLGSKIAGLPGAVAGGVLGHQATKEGKKSRIGSVMEMYDDHLFLIYINGKLAADTPIEKKQKNQYERVIKSALPDAEVTFKATPRHYYSAEELAEGTGRIRAGLAGILLLGGLLGLNNHEAQKVYDQSHQLQQLTQVYLVAKKRGDEAKMKEVKRRIGNHKMRLDLGKGDVDFDGLPGKDDIKDIDYINAPGEK